MNFILAPLDALRAATRARFEDKTFSYPSNITAGVICAVLAIIMLIAIPGQIEVSEKDTVNGRVFPELLMYLMLICSAVLIIKDVIRIITHQPLEMKTINIYVEIKAAVIICILIATYLISKYTELFVAGSIFCVLAFLLFFNCRKPLYYAITLSIAVLIWVAFKFGLGVNF
ncbi:tripartite tricarboxylate transporter TctB family protein [Anaerobiospirillum sp. NML120449]|uniref:tripartite tricarboxylate transporter TctB family protein n=1 Tax=Anaerobiospirillum sp. NML120449 TaxID=2932817 RepID=UPI001FF5C95A|nr:tripartite tricarboxylate transporter TctB family protein [Anaerobiospirillum sp. NML120449]MCK0526908.1 tripartite tricarboxylate transporter TctB family protein [Anaerobiospirillum sp. NML120449]